MKFNKFFSIEIDHDYFQESLCNDLLILPTTQCSRLLKNYRLLFSNSQQSTVSVFTALNDKEKPFIAPASDISFDFFVFLINPDFAAYSKLPVKKAEEIYLFSTKNVDSKNPSRLISSAIKKPQQTLARNKPLFGLVQIFFTGTFPISYTLHFEAAEATWKYYLLANNNLPNLTINGSSAGIDFARSKKTGKDQADQVAEAINNNFPGSNLLVFESQAPIAYQKSGRKDIQLINADKNSILINHLPNPSFNENGIKIINIQN